MVSEEVVTITVSEVGNQTPLLSVIGSQSTTEGTLLGFSVSATDADGTTPVLTASPLPSGASFTDNGDGSGTFDWTPDFVQAGIYNVTFTASDGVLADSEIVQITVSELGNQSPVLSAIGSKATTEGIQLSFAVTSSDPDLSIPTLSAVSLPTGASFVDNVDGTGVFDWIPDCTLAP